MQLALSPAEPLGRRHITKLRSSVRVMGIAVLPAILPALQAFSHVPNLMLFACPNMQQNTAIIEGWVLCVYPILECLGRDIIGMFSSGLLEEPHVHAFTTQSGLKLAVAIQPETTILRNIAMRSADGANYEFNHGLLRAVDVTDHPVGATYVTEVLTNVHCCYVAVVATRLPGKCCSHLLLSALRSSPLLISLKAAL